MFQCWAGLYPRPQPCNAAPSCMPCTATECCVVSQTQRQLVDFVHSTLKPRYQARQLSKEAVKWVASKTANKVQCYILL